MPIVYAFVAEWASGRVVGDEMAPGYNAAAAAAKSVLQRMANDPDTSKTFQFQS